MAKSTLRLQITTPDAVKIDEDVDMVIMRCLTGDMGILPNHEPISTMLDIGILRLFNGEIERRVAVLGGIAQVKDNVVTILANDAQWPEDIDLDSVKAERERMELRAQEHRDAMEMQRDQVLLKRTLVQIEVSSHQMISKIEDE